MKMSSLVQRVCVSGAQTAPCGLHGPGMAVNVAQHKITNLSKTL